MPLHFSACFGQVFLDMGLPQTQLVPQVRTSSAGLGRNAGQAGSKSKPNLKLSLRQVKAVQTGSKWSGASGAVQTGSRMSPFPADDANATIRVCCKLLRTAGQSQLFSLGSS